MYLYCILCFILILIYYVCICIDINIIYYINIDAVMPSEEFRIFHLLPLLSIDVLTSSVLWRNMERLMPSVLSVDYWHSFDIHHVYCH